MRLIQVGVTKRDRHPIYLVADRHIISVDTHSITDNMGKTWRTREPRYVEHYKVNGSFYITHVHGTAVHGPYLSSANHGAILFNEVEDYNG